MKLWYLTQDFWKVPAKNSYTNKKNNTCTLWFDAKYQTEIQWKSDSIGDSDALAASSVGKWELT